MELFERLLILLAAVALPLGVVGMFDPPRLGFNSKLQGLSLLIFVAGVLLVSSLSDWTVGILNGFSGLLFVVGSRPSEQHS